MRLSYTTFKRLTAESFPMTIMYQKAAPERRRTRIGRRQVNRVLGTDPTRRLTIEASGSQTHLREVKWTLANEDPEKTAVMLKTITHVLNHVVSDFDQSAFLDRFARAEAGPFGDGVRLGFMRVPLPQEEGDQRYLPLCFVALDVTKC
jgi:hypothetical protein